MLPLSAVVIAGTTPLVLAVLLTALLRKSARWWQALAALIAGVFLSFPLNAGFLRFIPLMLPEGQAQATTSTQAWASAFLEAAIPEELAKGICILTLLVVCRAQATSPAALMGGLVGLGFSLSENLSFAYFFPEWRVMAAFGHCAWGIILGTLLQRALAKPARQWAWIACAFVPPIVLHGLIDAGIFLVDAYEATHGIKLQSDETEFDPYLAMVMLMTVIVELFGLVWAVRIIRRVRRASVVTVTSDSAVCSPTG